MIISLSDKKLKTIGDDFYVAPNATVIGDVQLSKDASVWFNAILRGDNEPIIIGDEKKIDETSLEFQKVEPKKSTIVIRKKKN